MSKANATQTKAQTAKTGQAQATPTAQADAVTTADTSGTPHAVADAQAPAQSVPVPSVEPPAPPAHDEHHGRGGMYTVVNGQRVLVQCTRHESDPTQTLKD